MSKQCKTFDLEDRLIEFAVRIIHMVESLPSSKVSEHITGQIVRSGTSAAPNYGEAQSAESRSEFYPQDESMPQGITGNKSMATNHRKS